MNTEHRGDWIKSLAEKLYPFNYSITGVESKKAIAAYCDLADFTIHEFDSQSELRGWIIPDGWEALEAKIYHQGELLHNCLGETPLGCAHHSPSFQGTITKKELLEHCTWRVDLPEATVYDWTRLYRQSAKEWGVSVPWNKLCTFPDLELEISVITREYKSKMNVLDLKIQGETDEEVVMNAHNCHPYQANDDISGCATAIALFISHLKSRKNYYTYRLIIGPELYGPMFWLERRQESTNNIKCCILLKSVGNNSSLKIQHSFEQNALIDEAIKSAVKMKSNGCIEHHSFRSYYGNDETVFESPGFRIPTITLTRYPFPEYHTDLDTPKILSPKSLDETFEVLVSLVDILETNLRASSVAHGLHCLSSPKYDLYKPAPEPGISNKGKSKIERSWNLMMNCLPRDLEDGLSILHLSNKYDIGYEHVMNYVLEWEKKGLVSLMREKL